MASHRCWPIFQDSEPPLLFNDKLPKDYLDVIADFGRKEGFLGQHYLRLYRLNELVDLNLAYDVPSLLPEVIVFASDGGGEAFAFSLENSERNSNPLHPTIVRTCPHLCPFLFRLHPTACRFGRIAELNPDSVGMEVHERHPICFGGDPVDENNKVLVPPAKHAEIARFWNKVYRDARETIA